MKLYVAGDFDYVGGSINTDNIAKWTGEIWCGLGTDFDKPISCMEIYNGELYVGGGFNLVDGDTIHHIAKYIGDGSNLPCTDPLNYMDQNVGSKLFDLFPNPTTQKNHHWHPRTTANQ